MCYKRSIGINDEAVNMKPSASIATFMKGFESLAKLRPDGTVEAYLPTPTDRWTIGYGATQGVKQGMVWSRAKAEANFTDRLAALGAQVWADVQHAPHTTQGQFDAMVSLIDNIGWGNWLTSAVRTNHLAGHNATAAFAFGLWNEQRGADGQLHPLGGLTRRRAAEAAIYSA